MLTNWYIRRSRDRFWGDNTEAFDTLHTVLDVVCRVTAPLLPLTTEEIWRGLTGGRSVHLADWPSADDLPADDALVAAMDAVRDVCSSTSALRKAAGLRNRLPLASLTVVVDDAAALAGFEGIVADELNVKAVRLLDLGAPEAASYGVSQRLTVNARAAGPRLGKDVQLAIKGSKSGDWSVAEDGTVTAGGLALVEGEYTLETVAADTAGDSATAVLPRGGFVVLDTAVTPELAAEGLARDLVRTVQQARRDAGLDVSDRIALTVTGPADVLDAARTHEALVARETLATSVAYADGSEVSVEVTQGMSLGPLEGPLPRRRRPGGAGSVLGAGDRPRGRHLARQGVAGRRPAQPAGLDERRRPAEAGEEPPAPRRVRRLGRRAGRPRRHGARPGRGHRPAAGR